MAEHQKRVRHYHEPGDLHELTFSCYQRMPLITNDVWRKLLCQSIDRAVERWSYRLIAFVLMPEHLHLLVLPTTKMVEVDRLLSAVKRPTSIEIASALAIQASPVAPKIGPLTSKRDSRLLVLTVPPCRSPRIRGSEDSGPPILTLKGKAATGTMRSS